MVDGTKLKKILFKIIRITGWTILTILVLFIALVFALRFSSVQNKVKQPIISFLENKIGTPVELNRVYVQFPEQIVLEGLYLEDQAADTLLYTEKIEVNADLLGLLHNRVLLNQVQIENGTFNLHRPATDSAFNFSYIINAFSSGNEQPKDTLRKAWEFSVQDIELAKIDFHFHDHLGGSQVDVKLGKLELEIESIDLATLTGKISSLALAHTTASIAIKNTSPTRAAENNSSGQSTSQPHFTFDEIMLEEIKTDFVQSDLGLRLSAIVGELKGTSGRINIAGQSVEADALRLDHTFVSYRQEEINNKKEEIPMKEQSGSPWNISINSLTLTANGLQYDDFNKKPLASGFDPNHFWFFGLTSEAHDIRIRDTVVVNLASLSLREKEGFSIESLQTNLELADTHLLLEEFVFKTPNSAIHLNAKASFTSLASLPDNYPQSKIDLAITDSHLAARDMMFFLPQVRESLPKPVAPHNQIHLNTRLTGQLNKLRILEMDLKMLDSTRVSVSGTVEGLPDINQTRVNLEVNEIRSTKVDIEALLPDSLLPKNINLPQWAAIKGKVSGSLASAEADVELASSAGHVEVKGRYANSSYARYNFTVEANRVALGTILGIENMGRTSLNIQVDGQGVALNEINTKVEGQLSSFQYNHYTYTNLDLSGTINQNVVSLTALMEDKNISFLLKGDMDYTEKVPSYQFKLDLRNADFQQLQLSERPLKMKASIESNLVTDDFKVINGNIAVRDVAIYNGDVLHTIDSLLVVSIDEERKSKISIQSDVINGEFAGTFNMMGMLGVLMQHINRYFSMRDTTIRRFEQPQNFKFNLTIKNTLLLSEVILPDLTSFVPGKIEGEFDSEKSILGLHVFFTNIQYGRGGLDSLSLKIDSDKKSLNYKLRLKEFFVDSLYVEVLQLAGVLQNDSLLTSLLVLDSALNKKYEIGARVTSYSNGFRFHLKDDQLLLNYQPWSVPSRNYFQFGKTEVQAENFVFTRDEQKLRLAVQNDSSFHFYFDQFQLSNLTRIVSGITPVAGTMNGEFQFTRKKQDSMRLNIWVDDLSVMEKGWGKLSVTAGAAGEKYKTELQIEGESTNVHVEGNYARSETPAYDATLRFNRFDLALLEPFTSGEIAEVKGSLKGELKLKNDGALPDLRGELDVTNLNFKVIPFNGSFSLDNERIAFVGKGIQLDRFQVMDENNNRALLDGTILTEDYQDFDLDLTVNAENFQLLNSSESEDHSYYGLLKVSLEASVNGDTNQPVVDGNLTLTKDSDLTYVVSEFKKNAMAEKGIVQFVDPDAHEDPFLADLHLQDSIESPFKGIDVTARIELHDETTLNIVIDPVSQDKLSLKGNSSLIFRMDESGNMNLSGRYEITEGSYNFSFHNLVKREFHIEQGSSIAWSGDLLDADLDIRALYKLETPPMELVNSQVTMSSQTELSTYSQPLPFIVYLMIEGKLLEPEISFALDMPENKRNALGGIVYARLQDVNSRESDLNKQVFALLILKRFIAENPFESSGAGISNTARQSVSRLLTEQLNRLSQNVKGVQLQLDVKSYSNYPGADAEGETKVQLGVSKSLLDDRLIVKVSGNVDVEGNNQATAAADYIGDLALEYKLTRDGRFRVTGFRNSNFDMIDGELTETGVGLIYIKDYNTLRELFKSNPDKK